MFQFSGFPPYNYGFIIRWQDIVLPGCPIRKSAGLWIFAPNRSLSQLVTSFIGSWCQVILPTLFLTWPVSLGSRKLYKNKSFSWNWSFTQNILYRISRKNLFAYRAITYYGDSSQSLLLKFLNQLCSPQPRRYCSPRFGLFPFRSPLLRKSMFLSLPPPT